MNKDIPPVRSFFTSLTQVVSRRTPSISRMALWCLVVSVMGVFLAGTGCSKSGTDGNNKGSENKSSSKETGEERIVCNKFRLKGNVNGETLKVNLESDLPDFTTLEFTVNRTVVEHKTGNQYPIHYISTVDRRKWWRGEKTFELNDSEWKDRYLEKMRELKEKNNWKGLGKVKDELVLEMKVPLDQVNDRFGPDNRNFTGKAVSDQPRIAVTSVTVADPIDIGLKELGASEDSSSSNNNNGDPEGRNGSSKHSGRVVAPEDLKKGRKYLLYEFQQQIPMFQEVGTGPLGANVPKAKLSQEATVEVLSIKKRGGNNVYRVKAKAKNREAPIEGWVKTSDLKHCSIKTAP